MEVQKELEQVAINNFEGILKFSLGKVFKRLEKEREEERKRKIQERRERKYQRDVQEVYKKESLAEMLYKEQKYK